MTSSSVAVFGILRCDILRFGNFHKLEQGFIICNKRGDKINLRHTNLYCQSQFPIDKNFAITAARNVYTGNKLNFEIINILLQAIKKFIPSIWEFLLTEFLCHLLKRSREIFMRIYAKSDQRILRIYLLRIPIQTKSNYKHSWRED